MKNDATKSQLILDESKDVIIDHQAPPGLQIHQLCHRKYFLLKLYAGHLLICYRNKQILVFQDNLDLISAQIINFSVCFLRNVHFIFHEKCRI